MEQNCTLTRGLTIRTVLVRNSAGGNPDEKAQRLRRLIRTRQRYLYFARYENVHKWEFIGGAASLLHTRNL